MRRSFLSLLLLAITAAFTAQAYAQAQTNPVGFNTVTVQTGKIGALSLPLDNLPNFSGAMTSHTANTITTTGAGFTPSPDANNNSFGPFASNPHVVRMLSGASIGRQFQIASNTIDTITLTTNLTTVADGDRYEVLPCQTLLSLFGAGAPNLSHVTNVQSSSAAVDNVLIRGSAGWLTYYFDETQPPSGHWLREGGGTTNRDAIALLPEQGFLLVRRSATDYTFTNLGGVPITQLKTDLPANKITSFANRFPVATTLAGLNLHTIPAWIKDASSTSPNSAADDNVLVRGSAGWLTYYYIDDNANNIHRWVREGGGLTDRGTTTVIDIGTSVLVVRRPGTDITLDQPLPYTP